MEEIVFYKCELSNGIVYVFSEYAGFLNDDYVFGKPIYIKKNNYTFLIDEFKTKELDEGLFVNLAYRKNGKNYSNVSDYEMKDLALKEFEELTAYNGIFDNFVFVNKQYVTKTIYPRLALKTMRSKNKTLDIFATKIQTLFDISPNQLGITGSLSLGAKTFEDYDFVFYGSPQELKKVKNKIDSLIKNKNRQVYTSGLFWKARFKYLNKIVCCFFNYDDYLPQLKEVYNLTLNKQSTFNGIVANDNYSLSKNAYFKLNNSSFNSVILLSNMFKNAINVGDEISGKCYECVLQNGEKLALVKNPQINLNDFLQYFKP